MNQYIIYTVVSVLLAVCGYIAVSEGYQDKVYRAIYRLVCAAERQITGTRRGQERKARVIASIHAWLPRWAALFITEKDIDDLIELAVAKMKQLLAEGADLPDCPELLNEEQAVAVSGSRAAKPAGNAPARESK